jgi:hypothetical protein
MTPLLPRVSTLLRHSLTDPRWAARELLGMGVPAEARWTGAAIVVVLSLIVTQALVLGLPPEPLNPLDAAMRSPVTNAAMQGGMILLMAFGMSVVAGWFGGVLAFADGLLLAVWIEFVLFCVQIVVLALSFLVPVFGPLGLLASMVILFWLVTVFTAEANRFRSTALTFFGVIGFLFVFATLGAVLMAVLGLTPVPAA